ncbi:MAG: hypothetical protein GY861_16385 [bacterium]|nr:hypothetical protein [bacterium]
MNNIDIQQSGITSKGLGFDKVLATIASVMLLIVLIIIAITPAATHREFTIYDSYPFYFWIFFIVSAGCGIGILIHQAFSTHKTNWWLAGLCIVIATNSVFLGLPYFHGYGFWPGGDAMTHVGNMVDIIKTGHIGDQNYYPGVHLLGASLWDVTNLSREAVSNLLFVCWYAMYLLNVYLLATVVTKHRGQSLLITALASPLIFSSLIATIHPSYLSLYLIPLLLYFVYRRTNTAERQHANILMVIVLALALVIIHPLTSLFAIALLFALDFAKHLFRYIASRRESSLLEDLDIPESYTIPLLMLIIWALWYLIANEFGFIEQNINEIYDFLLDRGDDNPFQTETSDLTRSDMSIWQLLELTIYRYGAIFAYFVVSFVAMAAVFKAALSRKGWVDSSTFSYSILFAVGLGMALFSMLARSGEFEPVRIARSFLMIAPFIIGLVIYRISYGINDKRDKLMGFKSKKTVLITLSTILVLVASVLSILNVYGSARTGSENQQRTRMEIVGSEWFTDHRNGFVDVVTDNIAVGRFDEFYLGSESEGFGLVWYPTQVPSHFGYDEYDSITDALDINHAYLVTGELGRIIVTYHREVDRHLYPQYTDQDYANLRADTATAQIYTNGEFEVWQVYGESE